MKRRYCQNKRWCKNIGTVNIIIFTEVVFFPQYTIYKYQIICFSFVNCTFLVHVCKTRFNQPSSIWKACSQEDNSWVSTCLMWLSIWISHFIEDFFLKSWNSNQWRLCQYQMTFLGHFENTITQCINLKIVNNKFLPGQKT